ELADNHYRIVGGDRLLWSGGVTAWDADPQRYAPKLCADLKAVYPQLGEVKAEHVWSGVLGTTVHRMPQIGEALPNVWLASGFGGHGLNTTAMAGVLLARAITEGDDSWRLFSPYELVWAGGVFGRAVSQVYYWWFHAREQRLARQARARDRQGARAAADRLRAEKERQRIAEARRTIDEERQRSAEARRAVEESEAVAAQAGARAIADAAALTEPIEPAAAWPIGPVSEPDHPPSPPLLIDGAVPLTSP